MPMDGVFPGCRRPMSTASRTKRARTPPPTPSQRVGIRFFGRGGGTEGRRVGVVVGGRGGRHGVRGAAGGGVGVIEGNGSAAGSVSSMVNGGTGVSVSTPLTTANGDGAIRSSSSTGSLASPRGGVGVAPYPTSGSASADTPDNAPV